MGKIYEDNSLSIGNTPLVRLNEMTEGLPATVAAKVEGGNPGYSVKCRIGAAMIWAAECEGVLKPGSRGRIVIEPTSGNTNIALAYVCALRGYPLVLCADHAGDDVDQAAQGCSCFKAEPRNRQVCCATSGTTRPTCGFSPSLDFEEYYRLRGIHIQRRIALDTESGREIPYDEQANLLADMATFVISTQDPHSYGGDA